jgi:hypothetical protein
MVMLALATALPTHTYRHGALAAMGRAMFGVRVGARFDSLALDGRCQPAVMDERNRA